MDPDPDNDDDYLCEYEEDDLVGMTAPEHALLLSSAYLIRKLD